MAEAGSGRKVTMDERQKEELGYFLENEYEAVLTVDQDWRFTFVNRVAGELAGQPPASLIGMNAWEVFPQAVGTFIYAELHAAAAGRRPRRFAEYFPAIDRWIEVDAYPTRAGLLAMVRDITAQKLAVQQVQSKLEQLQVLFELAVAVSRSDEPQQIYQAAVRGLTRAVGADGAAVLVFDPDNVLRFKAWIGLSDEYRAATEGRSPWVRGERKVEPIAINDVIAEPRPSDERDAHAKEGIKSLAFVPLIGKSGVIGQFALYYRKPHRFQEEELKVAQTIGTHIGLAAERQQSEALLRESEERFRAIFSQAAMGLAQIGLDGSWLVVNERYCRLIGYTKDELRKKTLDEITHPGDREAAAFGRRLLLSGEVSSHTMEKRYIRKDQSIAWGRLYRSLVRDSENRPLYFIAVVEDITDKVLADRGRRESEERLKIAQSAARLAVWDRDLRSDILSTSGEYDGLFGLTPGHPPLTFEDWLAIIHPDDRDQVRARIRDTIERTHVWDMEYRIVWPDGSIHWLLGKGKVLIDEAGQPFRFAGVSLDITDRKLAEAALRESEDRFRKIADTAPVMIWLSGPDKGMIFFNKVWLDFTGRTLQQEAGQGWTADIHPNDFERCVSEYVSYFDSRKNFHIEYRLRRADGEYRWMLCSGVPRYVDGVFAGYIGSDVDITYVKRAQEEALVRQKLESMGLLASGVAHDFNNLLGGILASVELALTESAGIQPVEEELTRVKAASIRGAELVRQLMIYSGKESPQFEIADVSLLVAEMLDLLKATISKHAALKTDLGRGLPAVHASLAQIRQVIMNLVINASEAIGEQEGEIQISTSLVRITPQSSSGFGAETDLPADDYVQLEVSDTGVGMTPEVQAKIFDPFFTTKFAGRGLGLAVTQGIVRRHRGAITLRPRDHGTTFQVLLPCTQEPAQQAPIAVSNSTIPALPPVGTILVVEDEELLRTAISKSLRKRGFSVIEAVDGSAAINLVSTEHSISTVLLDATLPGVGSRHVFDSMRRLRPDLKIVLTSAYSKDSVDESFAGLTVEHFIRKPFVIADLFEVLQQNAS